MKNVLMRAGIAMLIIQLLSVATVKARPDHPVKPAKFTGRIKSDLDSCKLYVYVSPAYLKEVNASSSRVYVNVDANGRFSFQLPAVDYPARIYMYEDETGAGITNYYLVEQGDNIFVNIDLKDNDPQIEFSGRGAEKYTCSKKINQLLDKKLRFASGTDKNIDSVLNEAKTIIKSYRVRVGSQLFDILLEDVTGELYQNLFSSAVPYGFTNKALEGKLNTSDSEYIKTKETFSNLRLNYWPVSNETNFYSPVSIEYVYEMIKLQSIFDHEGRLSFADFYNTIIKSSAGTVREKLLIYLLQHPVDMALLFAGTDPEVYRRCVLNADSLIVNPSLKRVIGNIKKSKIKGATFFDINLPADSSGKMVSLADFRGKVVLLDCWAYNCTGCSKFAQEFHKKVYPLFASDPDFRVVSVMIGEGTEKGYKGYLKRMRGETDLGFEDISIYTYPDYINLFAKRTEKSVRDFEAFYNIYGVPFLLLIDKQGKVFSSTLPFFTNAKDTDQIDQMISLIKAALSQ
jgi:thiol-disulfide isomerase/thioredoxin